MAHRKLKGTSVEVLRTCSRRRSSRLSASSAFCICDDVPTTCEIHLLTMHNPIATSQSNQILL
jgi:hypothetical protein